MLRSIQKWVMNTFGFSKSETNGSLVILTIVILLAIVPRFFIDNTINHEVSGAQDNLALQQWYSSLKLYSKSAEDSVSEPTTSRKSVPDFELRPFDPNKITLEDLIESGFPKQVASNLINYRNAGGSFLVKADLQKIYGMSQDLFTKVEPFIELPTTLQASTKMIPSNDYSEEVLETKKIYIAINQSSNQELQAIYGIGPTLGERIIKYRNMLGGFHSFNQLHEVYGLDSGVIEEMKSQISLDSIVTRININTVDQKKLASHPYINYSLAKAIVNYRTVHGLFEQKTDLKRIKIVSDSVFNKLSPYISVRP